MVYQEYSFDINNLHYRALTIVYRGVASSFDEPLKTDDSITTRHKNILTLAIEMYKVHNWLAPAFMREIFPQEFSKR